MEPPLARSEGSGPPGSRADGGARARISRAQPLTLCGARKDGEDHISVRKAGLIAASKSNGHMNAVWCKGGPPRCARLDGSARRPSSSNAAPRKCLLVHITEFTGKKYPKAKHRFTLKDAAFMAIAGIWREGKDNGAPAFTMLTTSPGPDVEPYHDRQVVVLRPSDWAHWIYLTRPEKELLRPLPEGSLQVETVRPGKDQAGAI